MDRWDVLIGTGALLVAGGVALWAPPAGLVVFGLECIAVGVIGARTPDARERRGP